MPMYRTLWWSLGIILLMVITLLSLLPIGGPDIGLHNSDKLNHMFAYVVLMLYFGQLVGSEGHRRLWLAVVLISYGALIEVVQSLTPQRSAEWADLFADVIGIAIGWLLLRSALGRLLASIEGKLSGARQR